jgi:transposase
VLIGSTSCRRRFGCSSRSGRATPVSRAGGRRAGAGARHLIEGGLPTEALIAHVMVAKFSEHLPLYRQSQVLARHGVTVDR